MFIIGIGLTWIIIRGQAIKPEQKTLRGFPEELKRFLRELNWYI